MLAVNNGATSDGSITVGTDSVLRVLDSETLDYATLDMAHGANLYPSHTLTFGSDFTFAVNTYQVGLENSTGDAHIVNDGTIAVSGTLADQVAGCTNAGLITLAGGDTNNRADFIEQSGSFDNTGTIAAGAYATFDLQTSIDLAELGTFAGTGAGQSGQLRVDGTLDLGGGTLTLGTGGQVSGIVDLHDGVIRDGTIVQTAGGTLIPDNGTLDDATFVGQALVVPDNHSMNVTGGLRILAADGASDGTLTLQGAQNGDNGAVLKVLDSETLDHANLALNYKSDVFPSHTLTFGSDLTVDVNATQIAFQNPTGDAHIVNQGTIAVTAGALIADQVAGFTNAGLITLAGGDTNNRADFIEQSGSFDNTGTIAAGAYATFDLQTSIDLAELGTFAGTGAGQSGQLRVDGMLDLGGGTLTLGTGGQVSGIVDLHHDHGEIADGTIVQTAGGTLIPDDGTLDNVTFIGSALAVPDTYYQLNVTGGLRVFAADGTSPGTITVGQGVVFEVLDSETLDHATLDIAYNSDLFPSQTLTFGSDLTVNIDGTQVAFQNNSGNAHLVNDGTISVGAGNQIVDQVVGFTNAGLITLAGGAQFLEQAGTFTNDGTIITSGVFTAQNGIAADTGSSGMIYIKTGGQDSVSGPVAASETVAFAGTSGVLDLNTPSEFAGTIAGYFGVDTIDLTNPPPADVSLLNYTEGSGVGTLAVQEVQNGVTGTFDLVFQNGYTDPVDPALTGTYTLNDFSLAADNNVGTDIRTDKYPVDYWEAANGTLSGDWNDGAHWSLGAPPLSGTDFAAIVVPGTYTVTIAAGESEKEDLVVLNSAAATLDVLGTLARSGGHDTLRFEGGTVELSGVVKNGTIIPGGGSFADQNGTFDAITYDGSVSVPQGMLTLEGGVTVHGSLVDDGRLVLSGSLTIDDGITADTNDTGTIALSGSASLSGAVASSQTVDFAGGTTLALATPGQFAATIEDWYLGRVIDLPGYNYNGTSPSFT
ncbi:MAG: hypothetical protein JO038_07050 [Alphaproteobacteria bacterium]|nr:hypothetical protein [Alphaproteobacteria bacterium]